jgi:hypothetical protein
VQRDLTRGLILEVSYVGNSLHHGYGQTIDFNAVPPYTTWTPTTGAVSKFLDPTSTGFYSTNLIRSMVGYAGFGQIPIWTYNISNNYNALQVQVNRRVGRFQWSANYTFSKTLVYQQGNVGSTNPPAFPQWVNAELTKQVCCTNTPTAAGSGNRAHALNFNFGYDLPMGSRFWSNGVTKTLLDGWHFNGNGAIYSGTPFTVNCLAPTGAPAGYWTGTPTGGIPFRCQMGSNIFLPSGQFPSKTEDPRLQWAINPANFTLPAANSLGIGNTPPTLFYGPGFFNLDLSLAKDTKIKERFTLEFRVETFNTLNHFNPSNPNSNLTYNFLTGAQTTSNFGTITSAQLQARHAAMSMRLRF